MISIPATTSMILNTPLCSAAHLLAGFRMGYATVRPYFIQNYVRVEYHGAAGTKTVFLLKDSPLVCWEACRITTDCAVAQMSDW